MMDLVPGQPLDQQDPDVFVSVLGESMATMHGLDVGQLLMHSSGLVSLRTGFYRLQRFKECWLGLRRWSLGPLI